MVLVENGMHIYNHKKEVCVCVCVCVVIVCWLVATFQPAPAPTPHGTSDALAEKSCLGDLTTSIDRRKVAEPLKYIFHLCATRIVIS